MNIFKFNENEVRSLMIDHKTWFVVKDICGILGIKDHKDAYKTLEDYEKGKVKIDTFGGKQTVNVVNEAGFISLVFRSRKKIAGKVKIWLFEEVLSITRKAEDRSYI